MRTKVHSTQHLLRKQRRCRTQKIGLSTVCIHYHNLYPLSTQLQFLSLRNLYNYWSFFSFTLSFFIALVKNKEILETSERFRFNDLSFKFVSRPKFMKPLPFGALLCRHCSNKSWIITNACCCFCLKKTENSIFYTGYFFLRATKWWL